MLVLLLLVFSLAVDAHAQHLRLYACVLANDEPANFMAGSSIGAGLWQSDDTGRTWVQLGAKHVKGYSMRVNPGSNGRVLYFAAGNGLWRSTDAGASWKVLTDWRITEVMDVEIEPDDHSSIWIATAHGVLHSEDNGRGWHPVQKGLKTPYVSAIRFKEGKLYVAGEDGIFYFSGDRWSRCVNSPRSARSISAKDFVVACDSQGVVYLEGDRAYREDESKSRWWTAIRTKDQIIAAGGEGTSLFVVPEEGLNFEGPRNVHALLNIGDQLIAGTLGEGIWYRTLGQVSEWQPLALPKSQVWSLHSELIY